jgi:uncharacterized protein (DUF58 family)
VTASQRSPLLDTALLTRLAGYHLGARRIVEGELAGHHRSPLRGSSIEFAEHKEYSPGDEIKRIDWKAFGRFDKYYVKEYEDETNLRGYLLVDASASMGYRSRELSKLEYAKRLAATIAYMLLRQQDSAGLCVFQERVGTWVPPRATGAHLTNLLAALEDARPGGSTALGAALRFVSEVARRRSLICVFSDLFDADPAVPDLLKQLRSRRHEVVIFHLLDPDEIRFPFDELTLFASMEDATRLLVDPPAVREYYLRELRAFVETYERHAREANLEYRRVDTGIPVGETMLEFLRRRQGRRTFSGPRRVTR